MEDGIDKLRQDIQLLKEQQQITNELLLATYDLLQRMILENHIEPHSEEFVDEFTRKIIKENTSQRVREEIGGLYSNMIKCSNCGSSRFMIPRSYDGRQNGTHKWTYWCRNCDTETEEATRK